MTKRAQFLNRILHPYSRAPRKSHYPVIDKAQVLIRRASTGSVGQLFQTHDGRPTSKWSHYLDIYDMHLEPIKNHKVHDGARVIEIGVAEGGSLEVWRKYFGPSSRIVGIDIAPQVQGSLCNGIDLLIGSQSDPQILKAACEILNSQIDVVIDDGSHRGRDQIKTFETLWPYLANGAVYIVEDLHTSYWAEFRGGPGRRGTFIEYAKLLVDDMHLDYHRRQRTQMGDTAARTLESIAFYDSMVVMTKGIKDKPSRVDFGHA